MSNEKDNKKLGQCHACSGTVSKKAKTCPHCGQKKPYKTNLGKKEWFLIGIIAFFTISAMSAGSENSTNAVRSTSAGSATSGDNLSDPVKQKNWIYESQEGVRNRLKDPASAKFRNSFFAVWKDTPVVCGEVNSRNSMGGYGGFQRFVAAGNSIAYLEEEVADFQNVWHEMCQR